MRIFSANASSTADTADAVFFIDKCYSQIYEGGNKIEKSHNSLGFSELQRCFYAIVLETITARVARKPNSVPGSGYPCRATIIHLWMPVARHLLRPTRELGRATLERSPIWSCTGWGLPSFPGHPGNWCALTAPFHPYPKPNEPA